MDCFFILDIPIATQTRLKIRKKKLTDKLKFDKLHLNNIMQNKTRIGPKINQNRPLFSCHPKTSIFGNKPPERV